MTDANSTQWLCWTLPYSIPNVLKVTCRLFQTQVNYSPVTKQAELWVLSAPIKWLQSIWLDKRHWWWLRHNDLSLKMAIPSSQTIHACFVVTFHTQASPRFLTGEFASELQEHTGCGFYQICFNKMALTQTLAGWYSSPKPSSFCVIVIYFNLASSLVIPLAGIKQKKIIKKKPEQVERTASVRISLNHSPLCPLVIFDSPKSLRLLWEWGQILSVYKHKNGYW